MALVTCNECGGKVSDKAESCPHCGCPIAVAAETHMASSAAPAIPSSPPPTSPSPRPIDVPAAQPHAGTPVARPAELPTPSPLQGTPQQVKRLKLLRGSCYCRDCGEPAVRRWFSQYCQCTGTKPICEALPKAERHFCELCGAANPGPSRCPRCRMFPLDMSQWAYVDYGNGKQSTLWEACLKAVPIVLVSVIAMVIAILAGPPAWCLGILIVLLSWGLRWFVRNSESVNSNKKP